MGTVLSMDGDPGNGTRQFTLTDAAQSLEDLFGADYMYQGKPPVAFVVSAETQNARVSFGENAPGHIIATSGSGRWVHPRHVTEARLKNATAGSNSVVNVTLEYSD